MKFFSFFARAFFCILVGTTNISAQNVSLAFNPWAKSETVAADRTAHFKVHGAPINAQTNAFRIFNLEKDELKAYLAELADDNSSKLLYLPLCDGTFKQFTIRQSQTMAPELAAKFPEIKTYCGVSSDSAIGDIVRCELTADGFHAAIFRRDGKTAFVEPTDGDEYVAYEKKQTQREEDSNPACLALKIRADHAHEAHAASERAGDCKVRNYRIAVACTGEYTAAHGGTVAGALAAVATTMNRVNGIFLRDMAVKMTLVANNDLLIFTNAATDPYVSNNVEVMLAQNQATVDNLIGSLNYDMGHLFGNANLGGISYVGVVCYDGYKAQALSTASLTSGDAFDMDLVCHEMGHQFGATHSFYASNGFCANRETSSLFEVGSGSTIMSYSGSCAPNNIVNLSDDYFHAGSLGQMNDYILQYGDCATIEASLAIPNIPPLDNMVIPKGTPFMLSQTATTSSGYALTYCWEQLDKEDGYATPPSATSLGGPTFRSMKPSASPRRVFPNFGALATGAATPWEVLSEKGRDLNFRLTVRAVDALGRGCTSEKDIQLQVVNVVPFKFTAPIGTTDVTVGTSLSLNWIPGGSNQAPINASLLELFATTNNGATLVPIATDIPNSGSAAITVGASLPAPMLGARLVLKAKNNVFFTMPPVATGANLPVQLLSFTAEALGKKIQLQWQTADEQNNRGFQIEKSIYPNQGFEIIAFSPTTTTNGLGDRYEYEDADVIPGIFYYYKLRQIDLSGKSTPYPVVSARIARELGDAGNMDIFIHPNPAQDIVKISVLGEIETDVRVDLTSLDGRTMLDERLSLDNNNQCRVNVFGYPDGIYILKLTYKHHRIIKKLMVASTK